MSRRYAPPLLYGAPVPLGEVKPNPAWQNDGPPELYYPQYPLPLSARDVLPEGRLALYPVGKQRRGTPRRATQSSMDGVTILKSISGEEFAVRNNNTYINNMGKVLSSGKSALVVEDTNDKTVAYKIFKDSALLQKELYTHQLSSCINVSPVIHGVDDNVVQMQRINMLPTFPSDEQQKQLVTLVARMVTIGLVHNNLHLNHIGVCAADGRMVLIDFGFTQIVDVPILSDILFLQVVMAQLYALIDPCNSRNIQLNARQCDNSFIVKCIYAIRTQKDDDGIVAGLFEIREETAALFNSSSCEMFP